MNSRPKNNRLTKIAPTRRKRFPNSQKSNSELVFCEFGNHDRRPERRFFADDAPSLNKNMYICILFSCTQQIGCKQPLHSFAKYLKLKFYEQAK